MHQLAVAHRWLSTFSRGLSAALLAALLGTACGLAEAAPKRPPAYGASPEVRAFAAEVALRRDLPAPWIRQKLAKARRDPAVQQLMMPPPVGTAKNWQAYRNIFLQPERIAAGVRFWRANERWFSAAETRWGVPAEVVAAIIGVETYYGRITGNFRVIDALATLSFDFPKGRSDRSSFFRDELEEFLVLSRREGVDPLAIKGSYAGAMGLPQFMPSSLNRYAVDFDDDGHIDLSGSAADAIGSVAHYLSTFGWQPDMPATYAVQPPADQAQRATLLAPDITPSFSAAEMSALGAVLEAQGQQHAGPLALVELHNGNAAPSYVAGTANFYVITRYNRSSYYALAVCDLAQALSRAVGPR